MEKRIATCPACGSKYYLKYGPHCDCASPEENKVSINVGNQKHKGRPKDFSHDILKQAVPIVNGETLLKWEKDDERVNYEIFWEYLKRIDPADYEGDDYFYQAFPVHEMPFDEWWDKYGEKASRAATEEPVVDCLRLLKLRLSTYVVSKRREGKEPTFDEIISFIEDIMTEESKLYLVADLTHPPGDIQKAFAEKLRERRTQTNISTYRLVYPLCSLRFSTKMLRHDELKRYLRAYDLKKKGQLKGELTSDACKDIAKAERILQNIIKIDSDQEKKDFGLIVHEFPGEYDYTQRKRKEKASRRTRT